VMPEVVELVRDRAPFASGDVVAAYEAHQRELYSFALASTRSPEAAEDVVQEAFLRLVRTLSDGRPPTNTRAWLYRVSANLIISRARRRSVAEHWLPFLFGPETAPGPEQEYLRREDERRLGVALDGLSAIERTALILASRGFAGREVAATIGRSEAATRTLLCRARHKLRALVEQEEVAG